MSHPELANPSELVGRASLPAQEPRSTKPLDAETAPPLEPVFTSYRRRLPHWRLSGATYFVTWRLREGRAPLSPGERDQVASALRHFDAVRYELLAFVVMDDHVHVLVKPQGQHLLEAILHSWKSFTAQQLRGRQHGAHLVWQDESFDRIMRDEDEFWQKVEYILDNPRRRWPEVREYPWAWRAASVS